MATELQSVVEDGKEVMEEGEEGSRDGLLSFNRKEITLSPVKQFLARKLGYEVHGNTRETVPWDSVVKAILLVLLSCIAIGFDIGLLRTVDGFGNFMTSSGVVGANTMRGTSHWIHHQTDYVLGVVEDVAAEAEVFHSHLKGWTKTLTALAEAEMGKGHSKVKALAETEKDHGRKLDSTVPDAAKEWIDVKKSVTMKELRAEFEGEKPSLLLLKETMVTIQGFTHKFVSSLLPLRKYLQGKVDEFKVMYKEQMKVWMTALGLQAEHRAKKELSPALSFVRDVTDRLKDGLEEFDSFMVSFKKTVRVEHVETDDICFQQFKSNIENVLGNSSEQFREHVADQFEKNLNISWVFVGALGGIRAKTDIFKDLDENISEAIDALTSLLDDYEGVTGKDLHLHDLPKDTLDDLNLLSEDRRLGSAEERRLHVKTRKQGEELIKKQGEELIKKSRAGKAKLILGALKIVAQATEGVREHLQILRDSGTEKTLYGVIDHLNQTFDLLERYGDHLQHMATKVEASPVSFHEEYASHIFSPAAVWNMLIASSLCAVAGLATCWLFYYLSGFEHRLEGLMDRHPEGLKGLSAFHPHVQELDTTMMDSMFRPTVRSWLRWQFIVEYTKFLMCAYVVFFLSFIALVVFIGWTMLKPIVMAMTVGVLGGMCRGMNAGILISESACYGSLEMVSDALSGATILPADADSCRAADLLVCSDFFDPMGMMLAVELTLKLVVVILLFMVANSLPAEIWRCFAQASQDIIAKMVTNEHGGES